MPDSAVSDEDDEDEDEDQAAETRRHDGFLSTAATLLAAARIGDWASLRQPAETELEETFSSSARGILTQLRLLDAPDTTVDAAREQFGLLPAPEGAEPSGEETGSAIVEEMDRAAAAWARENAGELVGQLEEATRGMLAEDVAQAIEDGWTDAQLAEHLADNYAFSETRAQLIAQNELAVANRAGARLATIESGVATGFGWVTMEDDAVEDDCLENEEASPIGLDDEWPNGDDPHIGCRCSVIPWTEPLEEGDEDDEELAAVSGFDKFANLSKADGEEDSDHIDPDHAIPVTLPLADPLTEAEIQHIAWSLVRAGTAQSEVRTVPVEDLMATQAVLDSERVAKDEADYRDHGQDDEKLPLAVERHGLYYLLAGHHHACGAAAAGATELRVEVMSGHAQ